MDQNSPVAMQEALFQRVIGLTGITVGRSLVSLPDARAFHLDPELAQGPRQAFQRGTEFAHIHAEYDGSLHLTLPPDLYDRVLETGWGEPHPISGTMMLFGPRNEVELEVVWAIVRESYRFATADGSSQSKGDPRP
ncbi:MAG: luciferase family protein [Acidimicrobiia bacterium]